MGCTSDLVFCYRPGRTLECFHTSFALGFSTSCTARYCANKTLNRTFLGDGRHERPQPRQSPALVCAIFTRQRSHLRLCWYHTQWRFTDISDSATQRPTRPWPRHITVFQVQRFCGRASVSALLCLAKQTNGPCWRNAMHTIIRTACIAWHGMASLLPSRRPWIDGDLFLTPASGVSHDESR